MNRRFKALKLAKETDAKESWNEYKKLRNEVTYLLRTAEANYWKEKFASIKSSKDFWRLVGTLTNKKMQSLIGPIWDGENNIILDDMVKAEAMNDYFTATGPILAAKVNSGKGFIDMTHLYEVSPTISQVPFDQDYTMEDIKNVYHL